MKHKLLSILLSLVMVLSLLPTAALATEDVYTALPTASTNGEITLDKDVVLNTSAAISADTTINLNDHSISLSGENNKDDTDGNMSPVLYIKSADVKLTIKGNGSIKREMTAHSNSDKAVACGIWVPTGTLDMQGGTIVAATNGEEAIGVMVGNVQNYEGTFTMSGGTIDAYTTDGEGTAYGVYVSGVAGGTGGGHATATFTMTSDSTGVINAGVKDTLDGNVVHNKGAAYGVFVAGNSAAGNAATATFTMNGGSIASSDLGISGNAAKGNTKINVTGGSVAGFALAVYHPQAGTLDVSGDSTVLKGGVEVKAGTVNLSGGSVVRTDVQTSDGQKLDHSTKWDVDGSTTSGYAVAVVNKDGYGNANVTISGGSYTGDVAIVSQSGYTNTGALNVTGGTFDKKPGGTISGTVVKDNNKYTILTGAKTDVAAKDATCSAEGNAAYSTVTINDNNTVYLVAVEGESGVYKKVDTKPTIEKKTHTYGEDGKCTSCGAVNPEKHTHTLTKVDEKAATCTETGNIKYWKCDSCEQLFSDEDGSGTTTLDAVTIAARHTLTKTEASAATKTTEGNLEYWYCSGCQKYFKNADGTEEYGTDGWKLDKLTGGGSSSSGGSSSGSSSKTETTTNKDGSTTTTTTRSDGTKVETTTAKDGTKTVVESKTTTAANGTKTETTTETVTAKDGSKTEVKTETVTAKDGTKTETTTEKATTTDGSIGTTTTKTDAQGNTTVKAEASVSTKAVETAQNAGKAVTVPVEVEATTDSKTAPVVSVSVPKSAGEVKVEIPVAKLNSGTVAVIVNADGTEKIVKTCTEGENGVILNVSVNVTVKIVDNSKNFSDTVSHWSKNEVNFVAARGIFNGVGSNDFGVSAPMTRGMVNTVLARLSGANTEGGETWYTKGNEWAVANGVSDGTNPTGNVTREQLATMLYRYAGSPAVTGTLSFTDATSVSGYAQSAMLWANQIGIIGGMGDGTVAPTAGAERAQVAAMLARYIQLVG